MTFLASHGYRTIAHDRRGHGRSGQPWNGNDMDTYADDLAELTAALGLSNAVHVGHSTGGGEVARYIGRHGSSRVAKAVLIGSVTPLMLKTEANPGGLPIDVFDGIRAGVLADRSQFFKDLTTPFYGANREGSNVSQGLRDSFWLQGMLAGMPAAYECIKAFSETDFTADLKKMNMPTLILHGGERYTAGFSDDTSAHNFVYDTWVYIQNTATGVANIEMDLNQVIGNGWTVIMGFQCDGWTGTWDYTANKGSATKPNDQWVHSWARCSPKNWGVNAWHHVQIGFYHDDYGNVTYQFVTLDGAKQTLNAKVFSGFALGWGKTMLINFQVDGGTSYSSGSNIFLDDLTVSRW